MATRMATAIPEAPITTNDTAPTTTTGELALPITSGDMLGRLTLATALAPAPRHHHHDHSAHRRESFRPLKREGVLMWTATSALAVAALAIAAAIIAG
jgi:hypothetical protein